MALSYVLNVNLWCRDTEGGVEVINGYWDGYIEDGFLVPKLYPDIKIPFIKTWEGVSMFRDGEYNEMLYWVKTGIDIRGGKR